MNHNHCVLYLYNGSVGNGSVGNGSVSVKDGWMAVVMIMPVMRNSCHYQQSFVFSMPFWELLSIVTLTSESVFKCCEKENCIRLHIAIFT